MDGAVVLVVGICPSVVAAGVVVDTLVAGVGELVLTAVECAKLLMDGVDELMAYWVVTVAGCDEGVIEGVPAGVGIVIMVGVGTVVGVVRMI